MYFSYLSLAKKFVWMDGNVRGYTRNPIIIRELVYFISFSKVFKT